MISVRLISETKAPPLELASYAALKCYQAEDPEWGKMIDTEGRLFNPGHHTTLQHTLFNFSIEGIAVGDVTFGLHLDHPFYNSDQRSGRFCAKMFLEPDFSEIEAYIKAFWPKLTVEKRKQVMAFVKKGVGIYHKNINEASGVAAEFIREERPFAGEKYIEANAPKIAQEQMRMFIPVIFPTGLLFSINTTVLAAMYRSAWSPSLRNVINQMVAIVLAEHPEIGYMFDPAASATSKNDWAPELISTMPERTLSKPSHGVIDIIGGENFTLPYPEVMHPVDLLHFSPRFMDNNVREVVSQIKISVATMGQDQRHRTIRRGEPIFSRAFYLPPILKKMKMENLANDLMDDWFRLYETIPTTLAMILAPYGVMVFYSKVSSFNALAHEQAKRLCWCAQEEIYHAGRNLRRDIENRKGKNSKLLQMFEPPCYRTGKCVEGARYCGRDLKLRKTGDYFPERKV